MLKIMRFLLLLYLLPTAAMAQSSLVGGLSTNATSPLPAGSCIYVDQGATTDTKLCSGYPAALGAAPIASPNFTGVVTMPSGAALATPATLNLTNATGLPYTGLPALSANQVLGAVTATTPSGLNMPSSCSGATNALIWTSGTGFGCNTISGTGTPGGTSGQIQYNNAGSFGGYTYVPTASGGLGYGAAAAANGSIPIGTGSGLTQATLTGSANVAVTNGSGTVTITVTTPVEVPKTTSTYTLLSTDMGYLIPFNYSGAATITLPATGFGTTILAAGQIVCFQNIGATADTITNSTGATMYPSITSLGPTDAMCLQSDGTTLYSSYTPGTYTGTGSVVRATSPSISGLTTTGTLTTGLTTAGLVTTTAGGVIGSEANATVAQGGTGGTAASGTLLDNITGFASTGIVDRTGAGAYSFLTAPAGAIVGTTDTQTLTNKSIAGSEINSGTVGGTYGGTGVNNGSSTITLGGNLTTSGAFATTLTATGTTSVTLPTSGTLSTTIASGTSALGTSAISSATCATVVTTSATNTAATDVVWWGFSGDPTAVTGYIPATAGMLTIIAYPTANNVNFKVCNNTTSSITPGAITLNWRVVR